MHMAGTERYECVECGYAMYAEEGEKQGLSYPLDGRTGSFGLLSGMAVKPGEV